VWEKALLNDKKMSLEEYTHLMNTLKRNLTTKHSTTKSIASSSRMGLKESVADIEPVSQGQTPSTKNMK